MAKADLIFGRKNDVPNQAMTRQTRDPRLACAPVGHSALSLWLPLGYRLHGLTEVKGCTDIEASTSREMRAISLDVSRVRFTES